MGSTRLAVVFAYVTPRDHARVKAMATNDGLTASKFVRRCLDYYMDQFELEPLERLTYRGRPRKAEA